MAGMVTRVCRPSGHKSHMSSTNSPSMVLTRDSEAVAQVARRWLDFQEALGPNPSSLQPHVADCVAKSQSVGLFSNESKSRSSGTKARFSKCVCSIENSFNGRLHEAVNVSYGKWSSLWY